MLSTTGVAARIRRPLDHRVSAIESWLFEDKHALYGVALARILSGCAVLGILVTNFRVRNVLFGPGSVWNDPLENDAEHWPPHLVENLGSTTFLVYYLVVIALAACWIVGWHTRLTGLLMLIGEVSIIERAPVVGDQGDNILRVGLVLLVFMQAGEHWSLDVRRRGGTTVRPVTRGAGLRRIASFVRNLWNGQRALPLWLTNGLHNLFLAALAFQLIVIYVAAGMFKAQGSLWRHGTALYYPLQLHEFRPFPFVTNILTHDGVILALATYVVMFTQLYFPVLLLNTVTRRVAIGLVIVMHLSIALVMALPWFSLSMLAFDSIFVSTATYQAVERWIIRRRVPVGSDADTT